MIEDNFCCCQQTHYKRGTISFIVPLRYKKTHKWWRHLSPMSASDQIVASLSFSAQNSSCLVTGEANLCLAQNSCGFVSNYKYRQHAEIINRFIFKFLLSFSPRRTEVAYDCYFSWSDKAAKPLKRSVTAHFGVLFPSNILYNADRLKHML